MVQSQDHGSGVLDPAGYVVLSFATAAHAVRAARALARIGLNGHSIRFLSDRQMSEQLDDELEHGGLAKHGDKLAFARDHRRRAERGCHWLVVRASNDGRACQVADCVRPLGAVTARYYGHRVQDLLDAGAMQLHMTAPHDLAANQPTTAGNDTQRAYAPGVAAPPAEDPAWAWLPRTLRARR